jgi:hypothetical protein
MPNSDGFYYPEQKFIAQRRQTNRPLLPIDDYDAGCSGDR